MYLQTVRLYRAFNRLGDTRELEANKQKHTHTEQKTRKDQKQIYWRGRKHRPGSRNCVWTYSGNSHLMITYGCQFLSTQTGSTSEVYLIKTPGAKSFSFLDCLRLFFPPSQLDISHGVCFKVTHSNKTHFVSLVSWKGFINQWALTSELSSSSHDYWAASVHQASSVLGYRSPGDKRELPRKCTGQSASRKR